jgi:hypothetical protein
MMSPLKNGIRLFGLALLDCLGSLFGRQPIWPEFLQIKDALDEYLNEAAERIIRQEVYGNSAEAPERAE